MKKIIDKVAFKHCRDQNSAIHKLCFPLDRVLSVMREPMLFCLANPQSSAYAESLPKQTLTSYNQLLLVELINKFHITRSFSTYSKHIVHRLSKAQEKEVEDTLVLNNFTYRHLPPHPEDSTD